MKMRSYGKETWTEHAQKLQGKALSSLEMLQYAEMQQKWANKAKKSIFEIWKIVGKKKSKFGKHFYQRW